MMSAEDVDRIISVDYRDVILRFANAGPNETSTADVTDAVGMSSRHHQEVQGDRHPFALENAQGGAFILRTDTDTNVTDPIYFTVTYKAPDQQTGIVRITSTQDTAGFDITVTETGADTGVFEWNVHNCGRLRRGG